MIPIAQLTRRAGEESVPARTVERDYVIGHIVASLARIDQPGLVFKGGTALRLCFFEDFRYSADLDFSVVGISLAAAYDAISQALESARAGIGFRTLELSTGTPARIEFVGPLGRKRWIKLDLADDELVLEAARTEVRSSWPDVPTGLQIMSYSLLEIAGEKLRCVLQRLQCRDVPDLHELFERGDVDAAAAAAVFRAKAKHRGINPESFAARFEERLADYSRRWNDELTEHLGGCVPEYTGVERRLRRRLRYGSLLGK